MAREVARTILMFSDYSDRYIEKVTLCTHQTTGRIRKKLLETSYSSTNFPLKSINAY